MAAVAIAKPRKKPKSDRVEPFDDTASEASLPSVSQKNSRPGSGNFLTAKFITLNEENFVQSIILNSHISSAWQ